MKKFAWLIAVVLIYEQTQLNVVPCSQYSAQQWVAVKVEPGKESLFVQNACIEKRVRELSRQKFKTRKLAERNKILVENVNGYAYRIEEEK